MAQGIKKPSRQDINTSFAGQTVLFERMTRPIPEYKDKKLVNFIALEVVLKNETTNEMHRVLIDATGKVKERLMKERICPWSFDGYNYKVKMTFDENGIAVDYELIYDKPKEVTHYGFELVSDKDFKYSGPISTDGIEDEEGGSVERSTPASRPYAKFTRLKSPEGKKYVYVDEFNYFGNKSLEDQNVVELVQKLVNKAIDELPNKSEDMSGSIIGNSKTPKFVVTEDNGNTLTVNLMSI